MQIRPSCVTSPPDEPKFIHPANHNSPILQDPAISLELKRLKDENNPLYYLCDETIEEAVVYQAWMEFFNRSKVSEFSTSLNSPLLICSINGMKAWSRALLDSKQQVEIIYWHKCQFTSETFKILIEGLRPLDLISLTFTECCLSKDSVRLVSQQINQFSCIIELAIKYNSFKFDSDMMCDLVSLLKTNKTLQIINLEGNRLTDEEIQILAPHLNNGFLEELILAKNCLTDRSAQRLADVLANPLSLLTTLNLDKNTIGNQGAEALFKAIPASKIVNLHLDGNLFTDEALAQIMSFGPFLQTLSLRKTRLASLKILDLFIHGQNQWERLDLTKNNQLTDQIVEAFCQNKKRKLTFYDKAFSSLKKHAWLSSNSLSQASLIRLKDYFKILNISIQIETPSHFDQDEASAPCLDLETDFSLTPKPPYLHFIRSCKDPFTQDEYFKGLLSLNFDIQDVPNDGKCLCHAIAACCQPEIESTDFLIEQTINFIKGNPHTLLDYLYDEAETGETLSPEARIDRYIEGLLKPGRQWGQIEIRAISNLLQNIGIEREIIIFEIKNVQIENGELKAPELLRMGKTSEGQTPIYLYRQVLSPEDDVAHYLLLTPKTHKRQKATVLEPQKE